MSEKEQQHHHHHHHHRHDGASQWKRKNLLSIQRRKAFIKWLYRIMIAVAIILFGVVIVLYSIN